MVFLASGLIAMVAGGLPVWAALLLIAYGAVALGLLVSRAAGPEIAVRSGVAALVFLAILAEPKLYALVGIAAVAQIAGTGVLLGESRRAMAGLVQEREEVARQLDRRIHELFTLQELSYILSESLRPEHILDQVARYAQRFLQAEGSMVALQEGESRDLRILSAEGTLKDLRQRRVALGDSRLLEDAILRSRIESMVDSGEGAELLSGFPVRSAAALPLRAHGEAMGVLAVTDRKEGAFTLQDLQLLSTVATQAAVVLANGRFFELVRQAKEEWETTFDALNEGIAVVSANGRISRANQALGRLLRVETPSLIDQPFSETAIGATSAARHLVYATRSGKRPPPVLSHLPDLSLVLRLTAAPIPDESRPSSVVLLIEDVTEQRQLESQLIHNEKMAAVGQLVSGVAHELNNPLTSITGLSEFLLEKTSPDDSDREHLTIIHHQAARAGRIVRNLLTFAHKGGQEKSRLDLNDIVQRTRELSLNDMQIRGITLDCKLHPGEVAVFGDAFELQQVLLNLLTNAAQAIEEGPGDPPGRIRMSTAVEENTAVIRLDDNGPGVPAAMQANLFTPFFTTKDPGRGTGLGLSISYGIIEANGGRLSYRPSDLGGAGFTVTLPRASAPAPPTSTNGAGKSILLVDDDPSIRDAILALFEAQGHVVEVVTDGRLALEYLGEHPYDLVITGLDTPAGDDETFRIALKTRNPELAGRLLVLGNPRKNPPGLDPAMLVRTPLNVRNLRAAAERILNKQGVGSRE